MIARVKHGWHAYLSIAGLCVACAWPGVNFWARNVDQGQWLGASAWGVVAVASLTICAAGLAAVAVFAVVARVSAARVAALATVTVLLLFSHQGIRGGFLHVGIPAVALRAVVPLCFAAVLLFVWRLAVYVPVQFAIAISSAGALIGAVVGVRRPVDSDLARTVPATTSSILGNAMMKSLSGEHVYFVILDGYAGPEALKRYIGVDDAIFVEHMQQRGYSYSAGARANYLRTDVALGSLVALQYLVTTQSEQFVATRDLFPSALHSSPAPALITVLQGAGYDFLHVGNNWAACERSSRTICLPGADRTARAIYIGREFLKPTLLPSIADRLMPKPPRGYDAIGSLSKSLRMLAARRRPFFALVHHTSPHPPFLRPDCSDVPSGDPPLPITGVASRSGYANSVECVNGVVEALADSIQSADPRALVVFTGDHGSQVNWMFGGNVWNSDYYDERSSILSLIRLPDTCRKWIRPRLSPINAARLVLGCLARREPPYIEDRTYFVRQLGVERIVAHDVTNRLPH